MTDKNEKTVEGSEKKKEEGKKFSSSRRSKWDKPAGESKPLMQPGELPVFAACALLFLLSLAYLVKYFSEDGSFKRNHGLGRGAPLYIFIGLTLPVSIFVNRGF